MSFISTIESGLNHDRVDKPLTYYTQKTDVYQLPIWDVNATRSSASEKRRVVETVENQLIGIYRTHVNGSYEQSGMVIRNGAFTDASNHPENFLIGILSGSELLINNVYTGDKYNVGKELIFSGLSTGGTNYLWGTLIEQNPLNFDYLSSRQYCDIGARITSTFDAPQNSVFLGTYTSGSGFNNSLASTFVTVKEHADDNQNPHGDILNQTNLVTSGVYVYNGPDPNTKVPYRNLPVLSGTIINYEYLLNVHHQGYNNNLYVEGDLLGTVLSGTGARYLSSSNVILGIGYNADAVDATLTPTGATILATQVSNFYSALYYRSIMFYRYPPTGSSVTVTSSTPAEDYLSVDALKVNSVDGTTIVGVGNGTSTIAYTGVSSVTWSHTVASGSNRVAFVAVFSGAGVSGITFGGVAMTLINETGVLSGGRRSLYYIVAPAAGASTVIATMAGATNAHAQSVDFYNVDQSTPYSGFANGTANSTNTVSVAEPAGAITIDQSVLILSGADNAYIGNLYAVSGMDIYSESLFRRNLNLNSGVTIDGLQTSLLNQFTSNTCLSGYRHIHSPFSIISGEIIKLSPKFYGAVTTSTKFKNNIDLDPTNFKPTLKHENISYPEDYWIRTFVPAGCNQLESIIIEHKITNGSNVDVLIYDCLGAELEPSDGSRLVASTSLRTTIISGIDQDGFTQRQPFDIKLTFNTSGTGIHYIGDITMNFIGNSGN